MCRLARDFIKAYHAQRFSEVLAVKLNVLTADLVRIVKGGFSKNGRELQSLLGSKEPHTQWGRVQTKRLGLIEGVDYKIILKNELKKVSKNNPKAFYFTEAAAHKIAGHPNVKTEVVAMVKDNFAMHVMTMGN